MLVGRLPWLLCLGLLAAVVIGALELRLTGGGGSRWLVVTLSLFALVAGALTGICQLIFALLTLPPLLKASVDAAESSQDALMVTLTRRGGGLTLALECLTTLGGLLCFGLGSALTSSSALPHGDLSVAARLLAHFGIGLMLVCLLVAHLGAVCESSVRLITTEAVANLPSRHDPRNPAAVVELLALTVGRMLPRVQDGLLTSAFTLTVVALSALAGGNSMSSTAAESLLALALVLRGFAILSHGFALFAVRTREGENPIVALWRGQAVFVAVFAAACLGTGAWLLDDPFCLPILAVVLGLMLPIAVALALGSGTLLPRTAALTSRNGQGLRQQLAPYRRLQTAVLTLAASLIAFGALGLGLELAPEQRVLATVLFMVGVALGLPLFGGFGLASAAVEVLRAALLLGQAPVTDDGQRRLARISVGLQSHAVAITATLLGLGALLTAFGCLSTPLLKTAVLAVPSELGPLVGPLLLAILSFAVVPSLATYIGLFDAIARAGRALFQEVERQCHAALRAGSMPTLPRDFVPSYRSCLELFARALRGAGALHLGLGAGAAMLAPALLPLVLPNLRHALWIAVALAVTLASLSWLSVVLGETPRCAAPCSPPRLDSPPPDGLTVTDTPNSVAAATARAFPLPFLALGRLATLVVLAVLALSA